jgi:protein-disulfide isomerase
MRSDTRSRERQEDELSSGLDLFFSHRNASRALQGVVVLGAFAILSCASLAQTPDQSASKSRAHVDAASDTASSTAPMKTIGNKNAPITMELYSDYQCPSCGGFFEATLRPMIDTYVAWGKVYLVHHDFPLQKHPYSGQAARWANAAAKIGKFQEVDAALYDSQAKWAAEGDMGKFVAAAMSPRDFKRVQAIMKNCTSPAPMTKAASAAPQVDRGCPVDEYIAQDIELGYQLPVKGTPTFVIHYKGQNYPAEPGGVTWPILKQFFDNLLSQ